jgi:hypothetical protein
MKILSTLLMLAIAGTMAGQTGEFATTQNGLIYSDNAIKELQHIVDSLNLKFKVCEDKMYYSKLQGRALLFRLTGSQAEEALKDMAADKGYKDLIAKYPEAEIREELVVRHAYENYRANTEVSFEPISLNPDDGYAVSFEQEDAEAIKTKKSGWIYHYHPKNEYSEATLTAYYFENEMASVPLRDRYARMVQYSECLIDTTARVYLENVAESGVRYGNRTRGNKVGKFMDYLDKRLKKPVAPEFDPDDIIITDSTAVDTVMWTGENPRLERYFKEIGRWDSLRVQRVDSMMRHDRKSAKLYKEALGHAINNPGATSDEFEEYVERYTSKQQALFFKRSRRVIGGCSMDDSPRLHALAIAELAGETASWEIFLRSHLDIMNDRFDRVSDGSYAWAGRQTYIKELEVLNINVPDLLLGISLRVENPSENHYFGSIGRLGRSLAESQDKALIEKAVLDMVADSELDDFNRVLAYWLFKNYNYNIKDNAVRGDNAERLDKAVTFLPDYLQNSLPKDNQSRD